MKTNNLCLILAKKGSGKTTLATALAYANDKPAFIISPNLGSICTFEIDKVNITEIDLPDMQKRKYCHIFYIQKEEFESILNDLIELENILIVVDELDFYFNKSVGNESAFFKLINYGRHKQNDLIAISRRMQDIPKTLTSQMDSLFVGKCGLDINDRKYLGSYLPESTLEGLIDLEIGEFYKVDLIKNKITYFTLSSEVSKILERRI